MRRPDRDPIKARAGRLGGLALSASRDMGAVAARAREGLREKFARQVDPEGTLPPRERARRAEAALKLHMARMSAARWGIRRGVAP